MDTEQKERLAFAAQLALTVHRHLEGGDHRPCGVLYCVDNPEGITKPVRLCGCYFPAWEVRHIHDGE